MSDMINELKVRKNFISEQIDFDSWEVLKPYYEELKVRALGSVKELKEWLLDLSDLDSAISEHLGWLYIRMTCNTQDKKASEAYSHFVTEIQPKISEFDDEFNKKLYASEFKNLLGEDYRIHLQSVANQIKIFRKENIPLIAELTVKEQKYGEIAGEMTVEVEGKVWTLQQAAKFLLRQDRQLREEVFRKIAARRLQDREKLDNLFNELVKLRQSVAMNAGFTNYRDYKFVELDRFDYTPDDCIRFHQSVLTHVVPLVDELHRRRKEKLKLKSLKPWDLAVDVEGRKELRPFQTGEELTDKTIRCFQSIDSFFGEVVEKLNHLKHLDLDSRIGKAPGGYNYPLYKTGIPFIFMNSSGLLRDLVTMVHEGGHAIQSVLNHDLEFVGFKELPSEVAELASMSMELISMEHWDYFFTDKDELRRAKQEQLEGVIETLPWICCVDAFQHWIYLNPGQTTQERTKKWVELYSAFTGMEVDWSDMPEYRDAFWQKQLHLFEVPFYYIEYGMAQLGAIAVWKNYKEQPEKAVQQYKNALSLGSTRSIPEVYKTAGIKFDFSENYIKELVGFVKGELDKL